MPEAQFPTSVEDIHNVNSKVQDAHPVPDANVTRIELGGSRHFGCSGAQFLLLDDRDPFSGRRTVMKVVAGDLPSITPIPLEARRALIEMGVISLHQVAETEGERRRTLFPEKVS